MGLRWGLCGVLFMHVGVEKQNPHHNEYEYECNWVEVPIAVVSRACPQPS